MKTVLALATLLMLCGAPAMAVYAPIPEEEQGQGFSAQVTGGVVQDSNIFGSASNEIDSLVYYVAPQVALNASLSPRTFLTARYRLTLEHVVERPGDQTLDSHDVSLRLAHSFSPDTTLDVTESFQVVKNPESLLAGLPLNTDQSYKRNFLEGRYETKLNPRLGGNLRARAVSYRFDNDSLARSLDRDEFMLAAAGAYSLLPETLLAAEVRYQDIGYRYDSAGKDKTSRFLLVGFDYEPSPKLSGRVRVGWEDRRRRGERGEDAPYAEISVKYDYGEASYLSGGYSHALEETSNLDLYTDTEVNRLFLNAQHFLTPMVAASTSLNYEPASLQGRSGVSPDRDEDTVRLGFALTYVARRNWSVSATFDYDRVTSDDPDRELKRTRTGVAARYAF